MVTADPPQMMYTVRIRSGLGTFEDRSRFNEQGQVMPLYLQGDGYARIDADYAHYLAASVEPGYLDIQPLYGEYQDAVTGGLPNPEAPVDPAALFAKVASGQPLEAHEQAALTTMFQRMLSGGAVAGNHTPEGAQVPNGPHAGDMTNVVRDPPQTQENTAPSVPSEIEVLVDGGSAPPRAPRRQSNKPRVSKGNAQAELLAQRALEAQQGG